MYVTKLNLGLVDNFVLRSTAATVVVATMRLSSPAQNAEESRLRKSLWTTKLRVDNQCCPCVRISEYTQTSIRLYRFDVRVSEYRQLLWLHVREANGR